MLVLALCSHALADTPPGMEDFAQAIQLTLTGTSALHELPLPAEIYRWTRQRDLADIAVFNGRGEVVPFALVTPPPPRNEVAGRQLPHFSLAGPTLQPAGNLALQVRTDEHGAIVNLASARGDRTAAPVTAYLVDASSLDRPVSGFELALLPAGPNYLGTLRVEASDDLQAWRQHASGAVATLTAGNESLVQQRIEFPAIKARYFRLCLCPGQGVPRVDRVTARLESPAIEPGRGTLALGITPVKGVSGDYLVETGGSMPIDRLRLLFATDNSVAAATFLSRPDDRSPWAVRGCGTFYRLRQGASTLTSPSLAIQPTGDRHWLVRLRQQNNGLDATLPQLEVGWLPHRLVFAARGDGPFKLAYGSAREGLASLQDNGIASSLETWERAQIKPLAALAGPSEEAGGRAALRPRIPATTWKKALLWGALLLGVLLMARMAWRLGQEMRLGDAKKKAAEPGHDVVEKERRERP
jgi:hypothetical protein